MTICIEDRLDLEEISYQILYSYKVIETEFKDLELRRATANWRKEIFPVVKLKVEQVEYVLNILKMENFRVYLELLNIYNEYKDNQNCQNKATFKLFKEDKGEEVCTKSGIRIWKGCLSDR